MRLFSRKSYEFVVLFAFHLLFSPNGCFQHCTRSCLRKDSSEPFTKARGRRSSYKLSLYYSCRRRRKVFYSFDKGSPSAFDLTKTLGGRGRAREWDDLKEKEEPNRGSNERKKERKRKKRESVRKETILSSSPWFLLINLATGTAWFLLHEKRLARCSRKIPARLVEIALVFFSPYLTGSASHRLFIAINLLNYLLWL